LPPIATLVTLSIVGLAGVITVAWFTGEARVSLIFEYLQHWQDNPPSALTIPTIAKAYLLAPTAVLLLTVAAVMKVSSRPRHWSRVVVVTLLLVLLVRYVLWRSLSSLNLSDPLNGFFSLLLLSLELPILFSNGVNLFLMLREKDRGREADHKSVAVCAGQFTPSVDIFIPTYNEPALILRRTILGCHALEYPNKRIFLLDDTRRPEIRQLAQELGCAYITRPDNAHAKAGNLNHALPKTHGELIVVFDADFVPAKNFLTRTVGFFQDRTVGLLQTHQGFYNFDPIARNLGIEKRITHEVEVFSRHYQLVRDGSASAMCYGSSFVVRRKALEAVDGFVTDSLCEDYFTGVRLSAQGYQVIYLNEKLSAGLAPETLTDQIIQRMRWARGTFQGFFIRSNPLTIPGLTLRQRLAHLEGILQWFGNFPRLGFLLIPLLQPFLQLLPVKSSLWEWLYFFIPYYIVHSAVYAWLNYRSRSAVLSDVYTVVQCLPISLTLIQTLLRPFSQGFRVTPKGTASDHFNFNWVLGGPLLILLIATLISFGKGVEIMLNTIALQLSATQVQGMVLGLIWNGYNLLILGIAVLCYWDVPKFDRYEWFSLRRTVQLQLPDQVFWGTSTMISEGGAEIILNQSRLLLPTSGTALPVQIEFVEEALKLAAVITKVETREDTVALRLRFEQVSLEQHRKLVELLFCRPGQWKSLRSPGEFRALLLLGRALLRPRILCDRKIEISPVAIV
jgi:cellulose synthase (UDP-forming)